MPVCCSGPLALYRGQERPGIFTLQMFHPFGYPTIAWAGGRADSTPLQRESPYGIPLSLVSQGLAPLWLKKRLL
jgi:hypothetical protein